MPKDISDINKTPQNSTTGTAVKTKIVEDLKEKLEAEREKTKEYQTRLLYLQADIENYRKRVNKEFAELTQYGSQQLILKFLPIIDDLEAAIEAGKKTERKDGVLDGVEMILKKISEVLHAEGISQIKALGTSFDPNRHEAVEKVATADVKEGTVIEEIRKGYVFKERVIRPSLVKVTIKPNNDEINQQRDEK